MTEAYVILDVGMDYNDEIYSIGGDGAGIRKQAYASLDEAKDALRAEYKDLFKPPTGTYKWGYKLGDFSYDPKDDEGGAWDIALMMGRITDADDSAWNSQVFYSEMIEYCEANDIDWLPIMPQVLQIGAIEVK